MLTDLETTPLTSGSPMPRGRLQLNGRSVLLATDGSPASAAATRIAFALAKRHHAEVHVVSVMDTRGAPVPPPLDLAMALADATIGDTVHTEQTELVRLGVETIVGERVDWDVRLVLGTPAHAIVKEARRLRAALIVLGLRRHGRMDRALHDETTLEVMRHAACPVLGVDADAASLPTKALAAVDFSAASLTAASTAAAVMGDGGKIVLVYTPPITQERLDEGDAMIHRLGVAAGFAKCRAELEKEGLATDSVVLHRETATSIASALLEHADGAKCDLITAGAARRGRLVRWMLGSVSTELVRDGRHSVLVVPATLRKSARREG